MYIQNDFDPQNVINRLLKSLLVRNDTILDTVALIFTTCCPFVIKGPRGCAKAVLRRFVSYELLPFIIVYVMMLHPWKRRNDTILDTVALIFTTCCPFVVIT
jgi:iron only hydrogenase large subunit-like protein